MLELFGLDHKLLTSARITAALRRELPEASGPSQLDAGWQGTACKLGD